MYIYIYTNMYIYTHIRTYMCIPLYLYTIRACLNSLCHGDRSACQAHDLCTWKTTGDATH